ncbi:acetyltransferase, partial [Vibrio cholerae]|nr:acetyltransferase [Vibrio cholerae]EGR1429727.1 acetyltransferase [Vibrio cholerae]
SLRKSHQKFKCKDLINLPLMFKLHN